MAQGDRRRSLRRGSPASASPSAASSTAAGARPSAVVTVDDDTSSPPRATYMSGGRRKCQHRRLDHCAEDEIRREVSRQPTTRWCSRRTSGRRADRRRDGRHGEPSTSTGLGPAAPSTWRRSRAARVSPQEGHIGASRVNGYTGCSAGSSPRRRLALAGSAQRSAGRRSVNSRMVKSNLGTVSIAGRCCRHCSSPCRSLISRTRRGRGRSRSLSSYRPEAQRIWSPTSSSRGTARAASPGP